MILPDSTETVCCGDDDVRRERCSENAQSFLSFLFAVFVSLAYITLTLYSCWPYFTTTLRKDIARESILHKLALLAPALFTQYLTVLDSLLRAHFWLFVDTQIERIAVGGRLYGIRIYKRDRKVR